MAVAVMLGAAGPDASALALGRVNVLSALGEPLRAEIDIPQISPDEVDSLRASIASPDAFRAAGVEYNPALPTIQISLQRRPDGRYYLRLTSERVINDPFMDLILEATWASGRIVRDYTMLFDPPNLRPAAPPPLAAQIPPAPAPAAPTTTPAPTRAPTVAATPAAPLPRAATAATDGRRVTVRPGDTAGRIAAAHKPASLSLDQMLIALLQVNPDAFINGNINRLRAGAVLDIPSEQQASLIEPGEARRTVVAQSRDFNEFRRRLAEGAPAARVAAADRQVAGQLETRVEERKPAPASPDRLQLSKGAVQGRTTEDAIARERQAQEAAARVAELNRNLADLNRLSAATPTAPAGTASRPAAPAAAPALGIAVASGAPATATGSAVASTPTRVTPTAPGTPTAAPATVTPTAVAAATTPTVAAATTATVAATTTTQSPSIAGTTTAAVAATGTETVAAAATPAPVPAPPPPPPPPPPEPSLVEQLLENPLIPAGIGVAVLALLGGLGWRQYQRKKATQVDSSFLESRLQPDSFFGASGGQRIDTAEGSQTGSSMVYSPSQLDAAGDVDPVAEADVYLAYGRDLQAEEILREALRITPQRVAIHVKLLEIYHKRRDAKAFEAAAVEAHGLTHGDGPEWERVCEMGRELDPLNPMYQPGGQPAAPAAATPAAPSFGATSTIPMQAPAAPPTSAASAADLDLDLDFSLGDEPAAPPPAMATTPITVEPTVALQVPVVPPPPPATPNPAAMAMDLGVPDLTVGDPVKLSAPDLALSDNNLTFSLDDLPAATPSPTPQAAPVAAAAPSDGMLEFDLGSLSLDLDAPSPAPIAAPPAGNEPSAGFDDSSSDPLATKLALAEEFSAIGDTEGARSLAQEVLSEAQGALKAKAQRLLAELA